MLHSCRATPLRYDFRHYAACFRRAAAVAGLFSLRAMMLLPPLMPMTPFHILCRGCALRVYAHDAACYRSGR